MAVFLGANGQVELRRTGSDAAITGTIAISDVNTQNDRFSFGSDEMDLITGDQIEIRSTNNSVLDFIAASGWPDNTQHNDGVFFVFVDEVGGIKLYNDFDAALAGEVAGRVSLETPSASLPVSITVRNGNIRILGQVSNYEINTERSAVDVTALSEDFRQQYSGLVSGNGRIECFFDYERRGYLDTNQSQQSATYLEMPIYLNQLILRTRLGSEFFAKLTLVSRGPKPFGTTVDDDDEIYYEVNGVITNIAMAFDPSEPVRATIDYVTTGAIRLRSKMVSNNLLQEDGGRVRLEANQDDGFIELEQEE